MTEISDKLIKILLGVVGAILTGVIALGFFVIQKQYEVAEETKKFYDEWKKDEAIEELQMLSPNEKVKVIHHLEIAPTDGEFTRMIITQEQIIQQLKKRAQIDTLNADQLYQIKQELKKLKNN